MFFKNRRVKQSIGRSMIEMLAVLAIIGILSVGMVAGYQYAMTSYKASRTIEDVITRATAVPAQDERFFTRGEDEEFFFAVLPGRGTEGRFYPIHTKGSDNENYGYRVIVGDSTRPVSQAVCRRILSMQMNRVIVGIFVNGVEFTGDEILCSSEGNQMTFYFSPRRGLNNSVNPQPTGDDDNGDDGAGDSGEDTCGKIMCYTGTCCNLAEKVCPGEDGKCPPCTPDAACEGCEETTCKTGSCCDEETTACFYAGQKCHTCTKEAGCPVVCGDTRPSDPATITEQECCEYWKDENDANIWVWNSTTNTCGCADGFVWDNDSGKCVDACGSTQPSDPSTIVFRVCCERWKDVNNTNIWVWNTTTNTCECAEGFKWDNAKGECVDACGSTQPSDPSTITNRVCCERWKDANDANIWVWNTMTNTCDCKEGSTYIASVGQCVPDNFCIYQYQWPSAPYVITHNDNGVSWTETKEVSYTEVVGCPEEGTYCAIKWKDANCSALDQVFYSGYAYGQCVQWSVDVRYYNFSCPGQ